MLDKRQMQFNLSHLIILRHLWDKATFVSMSQGTSSYCKAIREPVGLGKKHITNFQFSCYASKMQVQGVRAKTSVQKKQSLLQNNMEKVERKFCLGSSCQNENLLKVFLMCITGGAPTGICIQTRALQIFLNPGDKGMKFIICDCCSSTVNCPKKASKKVTFICISKQDRANTEAVSGLAQDPKCCSGRAVAWNWLPQLCKQCSFNKGSVIPAWFGVDI